VAFLALGMSSLALGTASNQRMRLFALVAFLYPGASAKMLDGRPSKLEFNVLKYLDVSSLLCSF
jgi:hypothetical protein